MLSAQATASTTTTSTADESGVYQRSRSSTTMSTKDPESDASASDLPLVMLGRIAERGDRNAEQLDRIEAQQTQILEQHNAFESEVRKLATDIVDVRARVTSVEERVVKVEAPGYAAHLPPMRAPSTTHESLRALAMETSTQTTMLERLTKSSHAQTFFIALGLVISGAVSGWLNQHRDPPPAPIVVTTPPSSPAAPVVDAGAK